MQKMTQRFAILLTLIGFTALLFVACSRPGSQEVIYVTATFPNPDGQRVINSSPTPNQPTDTPIVPTPNPTRDIVNSAPAELPAVAAGTTYTVQAGDTLAIIAAASGTTVEALIAENGITNPDRITVGQVLQIPQREVANVNTPVVAAQPLDGPSFKIVPDSEVVYSPAASDFNVTDYIKLKDGFLRAYSDERGEDYVSGVELLHEVATNYSVNPRLLLALLEYRGGWLDNATVSDQSQEFPMGLLNAGRTGLYRQLLDAANVLNAGYYGWKYRGLNRITFPDGRTLTMAPDINPGTAAVQFFLAQFNSYEQWLVDVGEGGFFAEYLRLFGDPFIRAYEPIIPPDLTQPSLALPFPKDETWFYTGGPHGGYNTGSAWSSIDFAPPAPPDSLIAEQGFCYVSPYWVTAVAPGVIARSGEGFVILDLDFDGNEHTGWSIVYLHIADDASLIAEGTTVGVGDRLGHPSCDGGFSSATHLHFGRRYNGEWMPVDCFNCADSVTHTPMVLGAWTVGGYENAEYQGFMETAAGDFRRAEQGREDPINQITHIQ